MARGLFKPLLDENNISFYSLNNVLFSVTGLTSAEQICVIFAVHCNVLMPKSEYVYF